MLKRKHKFDYELEHHNITLLKLCNEQVKKEEPLKKLVDIGKMTVKDRRKKEQSSRQKSKVKVKVVSKTKTKVVKATKIKVKDEKEPSEES